MKTIKKVSKTKKIVKRKDPLAELDRQLASGKTPKTLTPEQRDKLEFNYCPQRYIHFPLQFKAKTTIDAIVAAVSQIAAKAKVASKTLLHCDADFDGGYGGSPRISLFGYVKKTDAALIKAYVKDYKQEQKANKVADLTARSAAILTIQSLKSQFKID